MKINFNIENIIAQINSLDSKVRYGIFGVLVLLFVVVDYVVLVRMQVGVLSKMDQGIKTMTADTLQVLNNSQRIDQIKKGLEDTREEFKALDTKIRPLQDVPYVVEDISRIAVQNGIVIDQITPVREGQEQLVQVGDVKYFTLPLVISTHASYHVFGKFLNKLETSNILFLMRDIKIDATPKTNSHDIQTTLKLILVDRPSEGK